MHVCCCFACRGGCCARERVRDVWARLIVLVRVCTRALSSRSTALAIAGADYAVIASDTRLAVGYSILTRKITHAAVL